MKRPSRDRWPLSTSGTSTANRLPSATIIRPLVTGAYRIRCGRPRASAQPLAAVVAAIKPPPQPSSNKTRTTWRKFWSLRRLTKGRTPPAEWPLLTTKIAALIPSSPTRFSSWPAMTANRQTTIRPQILQPVLTGSNATRKSFAAFKSGWRQPNYRKSANWVRRWAKVGWWPPCRGPWVTRTATHPSLRAVDRRPKPTPPIRPARPANHPANRPAKTRTTRPRWAVRSRDAFPWWRNDGTSIRVVNCWPKATTTMRRWRRFSTADSISSTSPRMATSISASAISSRRWRSTTGESTAANFALARPRSPIWPAPIIRRQSPKSRLLLATIMKSSSAWHPTGCACRTLVRPTTPIHLNTIDFLIRRLVRPDPDRGGSPSQPTRLTTSSPPNRPSPPEAPAAAAASRVCRAAPPPARRTKHAIAARTSSKSWSSIRIICRTATSSNRPRRSTRTHVQAAWPAITRTICKRN